MPSRERAAIPERGLSEFDELSVELLRARRSMKWSTYEADVLPAFVAEMDFELAPPVREALAAAVERSDTGYYAPDSRLGEAFAAFASTRFDWQVDPARVHPVADVMTGVAEALIALTAPGDEVVVCPPIYPPFFRVTTEVERRLVEAPLARRGLGFELDLDALERAFAGGARALLLCQPHNPTGRSFTRGELEALATLAARHEVVIVSDEIHAPLTLPGRKHIPFLSLGDEAAAHGVAVAGASKGWNIAGLKCAVVVSASAQMEARLGGGRFGALHYHVGQLGVVASIAAFEDGLPWLDALLAHLDRNRGRLVTELRERLPAVSCIPPQAGYLAWLDCRELGLGDDPAAAFLEHGRVALSPGPGFGTPGLGFARLNFGTSGALLAEAVSRMAAAVAHAQEAQPG